MPLFAYEAMDGRGKTVHGSIMAQKQEEAHTLLRSRGLFLVDLIPSPIESENKKVGHLEETGMGYFAHMLRAWTFSVCFAYLCFAAFVHGVFPFLFKHTVSNTVKDIYERNNHE